LKPPCTERYARWCERTAVSHRLLLDLFHKIKINNEIKKTRENKSIKEIKPE